MFIESHDGIGKIEITAHAMNRASTRCYSFWKRYKKKNEGIYDWLVRFCFEALIDGKKESGKLQYKGLLFIFVAPKTEGSYLKLVTLGIANTSTIKKQRRKDKKEKKQNK